MATLPDPEPLRKLIEAFARLPGVGQRTARRNAYHLLHNDRQAGEQLLLSLQSALAQLQHCQLCNCLSEQTICPTCLSPRRDNSLLCIVESVADMQMIENSHSYHGLYYALLGRVSPLEGKGADDINLSKLCDRIRHYPVKEVIIATSFTAEGQTTAHLLQESLQGLDVKLSRIARGVPSGSELEYIDAGTLAWALTERR